MVRKDYEKLFAHFQPEQAPTGLFNKIILAIKQEQERQQSKRLLFGWLSLFMVSLILTPFSWIMLADQAKSSGIIYLISTAMSDFHTFLIFWKDFSLAILESLPLLGMIAFILSLSFALFTIRLFLYKRGLLLRYFLFNLKSL